MRGRGAGLGASRSVGVVPEEPLAVPGYVDELLMVDLKLALVTGGWGPDRLLALLAELNDNYARGNLYACHALLRAILDHVPPAFGQRSFDAVVNNFGWTRTDKSYMKRLADFRLQADDALHRHISAKHDYLTMEDLPPRPWFRRLLAALTRLSAPVASESATRR